MLEIRRNRLCFLPRTRTVPVPTHAMNYPEFFLYNIIIFMLTVFFPQAGCEKRTKSLDWTHVFQECFQVLSKNIHNYNEIAVFRNRIPTDTY